MALTHTFTRVRPVLAGAALAALIGTAAIVIPKVAGAAPRQPADPSQCKRHGHFACPSPPPPTRTPTPTTTTPTPTRTPTPTTTSPTPTPTPTPTTTTPPGPCSGPITITAGGTYSGCYQSSSASTPAVTLATSQPVTLSRAHIIAKGFGVQDTVTGTRLTVLDSVFDQQDPGVVVTHRAVELARPVSFDFEHNRLTDTDGIWIGASSGQVSPFVVDYNYAVNIGRYPHPTAGNCCVQFLQLDHAFIPGGEVAWNHTQNTPGLSDVADNINFYWSGGTDSTHRSNVHHNLIDGAYPRALNDPQFAGGGINISDCNQSTPCNLGHNLAHDNTVVSTTNFGVAVNQLDNYANNNLLVNDGGGQASDFGQAVSAFQAVSPAGAHATGNRYNWHRFIGDPNQWPCYQDCTSGVAVTTTEQQARNDWDAARVAAGITVGPR